MASIKVNGTKTISDLAAVTAINDADVFLIEVGGVTKKVTGATLKSLIANETPAVDNTLSITGDAADAKVTGDAIQMVTNNLDIAEDKLDLGLTEITLNAAISQTTTDDNSPHGFKAVKKVFLESIIIDSEETNDIEATIKILRFDGTSYSVAGTYTGNSNTAIAINQLLNVNDGITIEYNGVINGSATANTYFGNSCVFDEVNGTFVDDTLEYKLFGDVTLVIGTVQDVRVYGTSVVNDGVANIPMAGAGRLGAVAISTLYGIDIFSTGGLYLRQPTDAEMKAGTTSGYRAVMVAGQHKSTFYGLAKAAGDTTQSASSNAVGNYTDNAKAAIKAMLGVGGETQTVSVSGTDPVIVANQNTRYVCGEVTSLDFTPSAAGICDVIFTSGSTVAVLTIPNTIVFPSWFDPTSLEANTTYEISISDGVYGAVMIW